ncbi:MAG: FimV/HubP family polar landmark protein [Thiogranum sp.]
MAMLGTLASANVAALGLGEIDLKSALNQPLNAEIALLSATASELEELKVTIGSSEAFASAGIDRPMFLSKLRFKVKHNAEGKPVVMITSRDVVREPFLDFLVELSWSKGRLLREYTVLVDPPATMPAAAPVPQAPAVQPAAQRAQVAAPAQRVTHTMQMPSAYSTAGEYGPTQRNDTLWKIAQQVRPDSSVSVEQTMQGLLRANPEAFVNNNINNLKAGYVLRVPSREELTSISRAEAVRESRAQYAAWRESRGILTPAQSGGTVQAAAPDAGAPVESHLTLVAPETAEGTAGSASVEGANLESLQQDLLMANEALEAQRRQGEEMSSRLTVLEEQILNMQRLIQLKDDELARLQARAGEGTVAADGEAPAEAVMEESMVAGSEAPVETGEQSAAGGMADESPAAADAPDGEPVAEDAPVAADGEMVAGEETVAVDEAAGSEMPVDETMSTESGTEVPPAVATAPEEIVAEEPVADTEPAPVVTEPVVEDTFTTPGFVERLLANPLYLGAGGVVLALLAFFGLRRKRSVETEFQESILQAARGESAGSDSEIVGSGPDSTDSASSESSLLSEFAVSDMGSIKNDGEADPLAEADVYLAYGRYQQAEDLISDALEKDVENENLNLKLLEVYLAGKNQSAFDAHAQGILARLENSDDPMWTKVAEMGREMSPDNPMYQTGSQPAAAGSTDDPDMDSLSEDIDFDLDSEAGSEPEAFEPVAGADEDIDAARDEGLEFDIDLSFDAVDEEKPDSVEFTPPETATDEPEVSGPELNIDMDSVEPDAVKNDSAMEFDIEDMDLDSAALQDEEPEGDGELADLDEISTKLDLARAYIDMGDPDGARSILDEVVEEGNSEQQDEARSIMEQMTSSS